MVALEGQMNVFVEKSFAGQLIRALPGKREFGIGQKNLLGFAIGNRFPCHVIEPGVTAKAQPIQVARRSKVRPRFGRLAQLEGTLPLAKSQLRQLTRLALLATAVMAGPVSAADSAA